MNLPPGFWDGVLRRLEDALPCWLLDAWVRPVAVEVNGEAVRLFCPTAFHRERLRDRCLDAVERCAAAEAGRPIALALELGAPAPPPATARAPAPLPPPAPAPPPRTASPRQRPLPHTFDNFIVGPCNALAREAALAVAHGRQRRANPLFLVAPAGLGKTHLGRAIQTEARGLGSERAIFATAELFTNTFTRALRSGEVERFKRRFRHTCDLLVVDDVQFLRSKEATQLELFHTLCHLLEAGARVVVTGDRLPRDLDGLAPRLRSQLGAGLVAELEPPDATVRRQILRAKAAAGGVRLPTDCLDLLVEACEGSVRDLEGVLIQLVESAALLGRSIDLELTRRAVHKLVPVTPPGRLEIDDVIGVVAGFFGTPREALCTRSRRRDVLRPRQLAMYLCHRFTDASHSEIAAAFGRRHPSVGNAVGVIERAILKRAPLRYQVETLVSRLERQRAEGAPT